MTTVHLADCRNVAILIISGMRIPVSFSLNGVDFAGWLAPADDHFPPMIYQVFLNDKWMGNLTYSDSWHIGPPEYNHFAEILGEFVVAWVQ